MREKGIPPCKNCISKFIQAKNLYEYRRPRRKRDCQYKEWLDIDCVGLPRFMQEFRGELQGLIFTKKLYPVLIQIIRVRKRGGKVVPHAENFLRHVLRYFPEDNILNYALRKEISIAIWGDGKNMHTRGIYDVMARSCLGSMDVLRWVNAPEKIFDLDHKGVIGPARALMVNPMIVRKLEGSITRFENHKWYDTPYERKIRKREKERSAIISEILP